METGVFAKMPIPFFIGRRGILAPHHPAGQECRACHTQWAALIVAISVTIVGETFQSPMIGSRSSLPSWKSDCRNLKGYPLFKIKNMC